MNLVEKIKNRIEYGYPCMKRISELSVQDIVTCIEKIWKNSCTDVYETLPNGEELIKEYHCKRIFFEYDSNLEIKSIKIYWSYWDSVIIELSAMGLVATYKPEHGNSIKLLDLTWVLIEPFFFNSGFGCCL